MKIQKNIPIPGTSRGIELTATLKRMEIGDSAAFPIKNFRSQRTMTYHAATSLNIKVTIRKEKDSFRVWRVQ